MDTRTVIFLFGIFVATASCAGIVVWWLFTERVRRRVANIQGPAQSNVSVNENPWLERTIRLSRPFAKFSLPADENEKSSVRRQLTQAGWRHKSAAHLFFGSKTLLAIVFPIVFFIMSDSSLFLNGAEKVLSILILSSGIGYLVPTIFLWYKTKHRKREIFENFPDALDLLTICVEAGLGLDAALKKVADEIHIKSLILFQELHLVLMELRTGYSKEQALRNFAERTGVDEVEYFVATLIQSDRFGTSMTESLRIHSENLRTKRKQKAEEAAEKISLKLLFPLIFLIFPTLMLILAGPAMLQIYRLLLPSLGS